MGMSRGFAEIYCFPKHAAGATSSEERWGFERSSIGVGCIGSAINGNVGGRFIRNFGIGRRWVGLSVDKSSSEKSTGRALLDTWFRLSSGCGSAPETSASAGDGSGSSVDKSPDVATVFAGKYDNRLIRHQGGGDADKFLMSSRLAGMVTLFL